jgi:O-antigen/teichoic acid export membrane protein
MKLTNLIDVARVFIQQIGVIIIIAATGNAFYVALWLTLSTSLGLFAYFWSARSFFSLRTFIPRFHREVLTRNRSFVGNMAVVSVAGMIHRQGDKVIISGLLPIVYSGYYNFAYAMITRLTFLRNAVSSAVYPHLARLAARGEHAQLLEHYLKSHEFLCLGLLPLFAVVPVIAEPAYEFLFNAEAAELMFVPTVFLALGSFLGLTMIMPHTVALATGHPEIASRSNVYGLITVLPLTVWLIYSFGLAGAGASWPLYWLWQYIYAIPRVCRDCLRISVMEWYIHIGRILAVALLSYGIGFVGQRFLVPYPMWTALLLYGLASLVYLTLAYWIASPETRIRLRAAIRSVTSRTNPILIHDARR